MFHLVLDEGAEFVGLDGGDVDRPTYTIRSPSTSDYCFGVRWLRLFLFLASRVRPSTPPLSQRVLRHFLLEHRVGFSTNGIQTWPQTSHTATFIICHPMVEIIHNDHSAENSCILTGFSVESVLWTLCCMGSLHCGHSARNSQSVRHPAGKHKGTFVIKRCALYARVSTPCQSVDNQLYDLRLYAQQRGFEVVAEYTDRGGPGSKTRRPGLDAMLTDARKQRFGVVIVASFDRLARSTKHFLSLVSELDGLGIEFVSRRENIATDTATGRLFLTVISCIAELEADLVKERIRAGMRRRRLDGLPIGRQPLNIDHEALVRDRLSGSSLSEVAKRYSCSRASVVRFVRIARQIKAMPIANVSTSRHLVEEYAA